MPKIKHKSIDLLSIFKELSPQVMSNGQIRMECPFRENHTDGGGRMSFFATPNINGYKCFSCGCHGSLVRLLTTKFGVNYFEAMNSVNLTEYAPERKEFDLDIIWDFNSPPAEFLKRGYTKEVLKHFRVGNLEDGGMVIPYYENFNKPIKLLGYQQRWYEGEERRLRNSKGFNKKEYLYNLDTSFSETILVEGQSDVWRCYQAGLNACALMGTSLSEWQVKELSKFKKVYLALDNDDAGRRATERCNHLLRNVTNVLLVPYVEKDPGSCSIEDLKDAVANSTDYVEYSMEMSINWEGYIDMRDEVLNELRGK